MDDMVRVKYDNGAEVTLPREVAEKYGYEPLDKPATDVRGVALADKPHVSISAADSPYKGKSADELQAEADSRGLAVEGSGADGRVLKSDLLSALTEHDRATA